MSLQGQAPCPFCRRCSVVRRLRRADHNQRWLQQQDHLRCNTWRSVGRTPHATVTPLIGSLTPVGLDLDTFGGATNNEMRAELLRMTNELEVCKTLGAPPKAAVVLVCEVELRMRAANPYHNFRHVYDVAQFLYMMLKRSGCVPKTAAQKGSLCCEDNERTSTMVTAGSDELSLTPLEIAALWCACLCHDLEHPGHSSALEETVQGPVYRAFKAATQATPFLLESHHSTVACQLVCEELRLLQGLPAEEADYFLEVLRAIIAATEMRRHEEFYTTLQATCSAILGKKWLERRTEGSAMQPTVVAGGAADGEEGKEAVEQSRAEFRLQLMQWLMKCSDLANTMRPPGCFERWEDAVFEEFHREGDVLITQGLVSATELPLMLDRRKGKRQRVAIGFLRGIVLPSFTLLENCLRAAPGLNAQMAEECRLLAHTRLEACLAITAEGNRRKIRRAGVIGVLSLILFAVLVVKCFRPWPLAMINFRHVFLAGDAGVSTVHPAFVGTFELRHIAQWFPPLWSLLCAALLASPLHTLQSIRSMGLSKSSVEAQLSDAANAATASIEGTIFMDLMSKRDNANLSVRRRNSWSVSHDGSVSLSDVGSGRLARHHVRGKIAFRRQMSVPGEIFATEWAKELELHSQDDGKARVRHSWDSSVTKLATDPAGLAPPGLPCRPGCGKAGPLLPKASTDIFDLKKNRSDTETSIDTEFDTGKDEVLASSAQSPRSSSSLPAVAAVLTLGGSLVALSVLNRVIFRIVLASVGQYVHVLSSATNLAYLTWSWTTMTVKMLTGSAEQRDMLACAFHFARQHWWLFASMGVCESIAFTLMPLGARVLPKALVPVISQSVLPLSMLLNYCVLGKQYTLQQVAGVAMIIAGIAIATSADAAAHGSHSGNTLEATPLLLTMASYLALVLSLMFKDVAFRLSAAQNVQLDVVAVEGLTGLFQGGALLLLWPANFALLTDLPPRAYASAALQAFTSRAGLMPGLIIAYWACNILYRLATLRAVKHLSSLSVLLANVVTVPLSSLAFCLPIQLPLIGAPNQISAVLFSGTLVVGLGLATFSVKCRNS